MQCVRKVYAVSQEGLCSESGRHAGSQEGMLFVRKACIVSGRPMQCVRKADAVCQEGVCNVSGRPVVCQDGQ